MQMKNQFNIRGHWKTLGLWNQMYIKSCWPRNKTKGDYGFEKQCTPWNKKKKENFNEYLRE